MTPKHALTGTDPETMKRVKFQAQLQADTLRKTVWAYRDTENRWHFWNNSLPYVENGHSEEQFETTPDPIAKSEIAKELFEVLWDKNELSLFVNPDKTLPLIMRALQEVENRINKELS